MKVMQLDKPGPAASQPLRVTERDIPDPGTGQVLLRVLTCGVCHTDLHIVEGEIPLPKLPIVPGHEIVGEVVRLGPGAEGLHPGERVGVAWIGDTCGHCLFCLSGRENLCPDIRFTGLHHAGGYAQYAVAQASFCYPIPGRYDNVSAAPLLCAGIIGWRAIRRAGIQPGERVGLLGFGASAHITLQVLRAWGCEVGVITRSAEHRELALTLGAAWALPYTQAPPHLLERAIIFTPAGETVLAALERLQPGGVLAIASVHLSEIPPLDHDRLLLGEREIRSVTASTRHDARTFLALADQIPLRLDTETFQLEEAGLALLRLKEGRLRQAAAVLRIAE